MTDDILQHLQLMCAEPTELSILSVTPIDDSAHLVLFSFDGQTQAAVYYPDDDMLFTPDDWQSGHPHDSSEIPDYRWINSAGDEAIVLDGLPRVFTAVRDQARKDFGTRVKDIREQSGLTQGELARKAGLTQSNVARIESGRYNVTLDTITRLASVLGPI